MSQRTALSKPEEQILELVSSEPAGWPTIRVVDVMELRRVPPHITLAAIERLRIERRVTYVGGRLRVADAVER